jgi:transposase-like protein
LPFKKFCTQEKISPNTFQYWRRELRKRDEARGTASAISKGDNRPSNLQHNIAHWLQIINEINSYKGSINSYCRNQGVSSGTLHFWEKRLREMKLTNGVRRDNGKRVRAGGTMQRKPTFVPIELGQEAAGTINASAYQSKTNHTIESAPSASQLAAEIVHAHSGCQVRIFNGADRSTLSALITALTVCQPI